LELSVLVILKVFNIPATRTKIFTNTQDVFMVNV